MHMADALVSPAVGAALWGASAAGIAACARALRKSQDDRLVPMMGVLGAFVFAAQMVNFSIPGTGSSGHIGGGLLLAVLLGPPAAFLAIASVLCVQALFFADGGLLALGCNIFNLGFFPAFVAYPLVYKPLAGKATGGPRLWTASIAAAVLGLQLGAFSVVAETRLSGVSQLPFDTFLLLMQPIHLAIGVVEGLATAAVVSFVAKARPGVLEPVAVPAPGIGGTATWRPVVIALGVGAAALGGIGSWFASGHPDGLEWAMAKVSGQAEISGVASAARETAAAIQQATAVLPDYAFPAAPEEAKPDMEASNAPVPVAGPAANAGASLSGLLGSGIVLLLAGAISVLPGIRRSGA